MAIQRINQIPVVPKHTTTFSPAIASALRRATSIAYRRTDNNYKGNNFPSAATLERFLTAFADLTVTEGIDFTKLLSPHGISSADLKGSLGIVDEAAHPDIDVTNLQTLSDLGGILVDDDVALLIQAAGARSGIYPEELSWDVLNPTFPERVHIDSRAIFDSFYFALYGCHRRAGLLPFPGTRFGNLLEVYGLNPFSQHKTAKTTFQANAKRVGLELQPLF